MKDSRQTKTLTDYRIEAKKICDLYASKLAIVYLIYFAIISGIVIIEYFLFGENPIFSYDINIIDTSSLSKSFISLILSGPFAFSLTYITKNVYKGTEPKIKDLFIGFKQFFRTLVIYILELVFIMLWGILFIVPGFIKMFAYSMSYFVAIDNPNLSARECIKESQRIMYGHKEELFSLLLNYIGWIFLSLLTFGILFLWVAPRIQQTVHLFYLEVSKS